MSYSQILDDTEGNREHKTSVNTSYNWNDNENNWEDGKSGWEHVELICYAEGGRPLPRFTWKINNDNLPDDNIFDNPSASNNGEGNVYRSYGYDSVIQDMQSTLKFQVDDKLLARLSDKHHINTNPESGEFNFDIDCVVAQNGIQTFREGMGINVQKTYMYPTTENPTTPHKGVDIHIDMQLDIHIERTKR